MFVNYIVGLWKIMFPYLKRLSWSVLYRWCRWKSRIMRNYGCLARLSNGGTMSPVCRYFKAVECKRTTDLEERRPHDLRMKFWFRVPTRTVPFVHWSWFIASDVSSIQNRLLLAANVDRCSTIHVEFLEKIRWRKMLEIERNSSADDESTLNLSQALWKRSQEQGNVRKRDVSIFLSESENGYEWYFRENFARELSLINYEAMKSRKRKIYIKREKLSISLVKFKNQQKKKM